MLPASHDRRGRALLKRGSTRLVPRGGRRVVRKMKMPARGHTRAPSVNGVRGGASGVDALRGRARPKEPCKTLPFPALRFRDGSGTNAAQTANLELRELATAALPGAGEALSTRSLRARGPAQLLAEHPAARRGVTIRDAFATLIARAKREARRTRQSQPVWRRIFRSSS